MLTVKTPKEVLELIDAQFVPADDRKEYVNLYESVGRVLAEDIEAHEYVPDFNRSTVDGYALRAEDTFGCSESIPAILTLKAQVLMGREADFSIAAGQCCAIPTGGAMPEGADCCVMVEYTEDYNDGTVGIAKSAAPGQNMIYRGDDVYPGKKVLSKGRVLTGRDVGALAAMGIMDVPVVRKLKIGIISTGDELVPPECTPLPGQIRDVNLPMLMAMLKEFGAVGVSYGIIKDDEAALSAAVGKAAQECDGVIISGGSSVGVKDASCRIIESMGTLLLHGISMKPGKPTIMGKIGNKPLIGLPGHPVAAYFVTSQFVLPLLARLEGRISVKYATRAKLTESQNANNGRAQYACVKLEKKDGELYASPVRTKSGLITNLAGTDGYYIIDCDCEGLAAFSDIEVFPDR